MNTENKEKQNSNKNHGNEAKKKDKKVKKNGRISKFANKISGNVESGVDNSVTLSAIKTLGKLDVKTEDSWLLSKIPKKKISNKFIKPMKQRVSAMKEESASFYLLDRLGKMLLSTRLRIYGTLLLSFGIYSIVAAFVLSFIESQSILNLDYTNVITSVVVVLLSLVLLFGGKKTLSHSLCESKLMSFLLFELLGVKEEKLKKEYDVSSMSPLSAFVLGMLLGIASMFIPALTLIIRIFILLISVIIFIIPESGVILTLIFLPFSSVTQIAAITLYVWICYIFKLILGRRSFRITFTDCTVFLFSAVILFSGTVFSGNGSWITALFRSGFVLAFILVSTLIRSREWLVRCEKAIYISCTAIGIWSVIEYLLKYALSYLNDTFTAGQVKDVIEKIEFDLGSISVFDNYEILSVYIMLTVFFIIAHYDSSTTKTASSRAIISFFACLIVLVLARVWTAWLGFLAGFIVYIIRRNKKSIYYILTLLAVGVLALIFIPDEFLSKAIELCNFEIPPFLSRIDVWAGSVRLAFSHIFGIGFSSRRFAEFYQQYAVMGSESAEHSYNLYLQIMIESGVFAYLLFIMIVLLVIGSYTVWSKSKVNKDGPVSDIGHAGICSVVALLVYGVLDYSLYDYSLFICLFMILGLSYACCKVMCEDAGGEEEEIEHVYYFPADETKVKSSSGGELEEGSSVKSTEYFEEGE